MSRSFITMWCIFTSVRLTICWQYFTELKAITFTKSEAPQVVRHTEYVFGDCYTRDDRMFYTMVKLHHMDILGRPIIRGWLHLTRVPSCIRLVARDVPENTFRGTGYPFQICVPRISLIFDRKFFFFFFYEWFIPADFQGGMDWTIYFFGPRERRWW